MSDSFEKVTNDIIYLWETFYKDKTFKDFLCVIFEGEDCSDYKLMRAVLNKFLDEQGLMP
jgi:hypothetical protein